MTHGELFGGGDAQFTSLMNLILLLAPPLPPTEATTSTTTTTATVASNLRVTKPS